MNILSALLVALGLSMDNLAVTIASGCAHRTRVSLKHILKISSLFALAHLVMFSCGWLLGEGVGHFIGRIAPWVAVTILTVIGVHMIKESREKEDAKDCLFYSLKALLFLAFATSIDAWLVGMGLALIEVSFTLSVSMMVACVFLTSVLGFYVGTFLGRKFGACMEALGGVALILLGIKLLLEGLGIW